MLSGKVIVGIVASSIAVLLFSCVRYDAPGGNYNNNYYYPNPNYKGVIKGHIHLYDQYGSTVASGLRGIELTLSGYQKTAVTDSNGYYAFNYISSGTYSIYVHDTATAIAFGDTRAENVQFLKDSLIKDISLSAVPDFSPSAISAILDTSTKTDSIVLAFTADTNTRAAIVFVNSNSAVSASPSNYLLTYIVSIPANATTVGLSIPASDFHNAGINSGATAYFAAYGYVVHDYSLYQDYSTGKNVYTAISTSAATCSVKAP